MDRNKGIIRTSIAGIIGNIFLSAFKLVVGFASNSVAIRADAVNNLSDALSSIITIIGTRLSEREPDRRHPFGYGRIEYLSSLFIGIMILYAGFTEILETFGRIRHPEPNSYSIWTLAVMFNAVLVKILMGIYTRNRGKKYNSVALQAAGNDALNDSIGSAATLAVALPYIRTGIDIEAYVGLFISILIIRTGAETLRGTVSSLLGEQVDVKLAVALKKSILSFPEVEDVFDLTIHNYGKEKIIGSAHIEVPDTLTAMWIDNLQRAISRKVLADTGIEMLGITIYAVNSRDREGIEMREAVRKTVMEDPAVITMHGFYLNKVDKTISFEVETEFESGDSTLIRDRLIRRLQENHQGYIIDLKIRHNLDEQIGSENTAG